jgi:hypothetical protein
MHQVVCLSLCWTMVLNLWPQFLRYYETDHDTPAPLLWLYSKEQYLPSDIGAQVANTTPKQNHNNLTSIPSPLTLDNLDQLNRFGANGTDIYLQSNEDAAKDPKWLYGVLPDADGKAQGVTSNVVITVDKANGVVDAFYFYFFAFNWGGITLERIFGNFKLYLTGDFSLRLTMSQEIMSETGNTTWSASSMASQTSCSTLSMRQGKPSNTRIFKKTSLAFE